MAKLDPDNWKSAKDVADEREAAARKRKRDDSDVSSDDGSVEPEHPKVEKSLDSPKSKKRKTVDSTQPSKSEAHSEETPEQRQQRKREKKAAERERKKERKEKARLKSERQQARKKAEKQQRKEGKQSKKPELDTRPKEMQSQDETEESSSEDEADDGDVAEAMELDQPPAFTSTHHIEVDQSSVDASDQDRDPVFSPFHESGSSSISSIQTPVTDMSSKPPSQEQKSAATKGSQSRPTGGHPDTTTLPKSENILAQQEQSKRTSTAQPSAPQLQEDQKARLQAALEAFRSARTPSNPAKPQPTSRGELLAQRRAQEERRKAEKKAQKAQEKEEAARKQEEEIAKRFSPGGSGSLLGSPRSPIIHSPTAEPTNFSFGRVAFGDGTSLNPDGETSQYKKKGPQDPRTALAAAQHKQARISGLDAEKRENIESKNMWSSARKRASGEKVKDDTSLLKKALKRHDSQKKKSEHEWSNRQEGVQKGIEIRQKKRNDNLSKRRDEKGGTKSKKGGKVRRPGFEGSFKGRTGGGKKKS